MTKGQNPDKPKGTVQPRIDNSIHDQMAEFTRLAAERAAYLDEQLHRIEELLREIAGNLEKTQEIQSVVDGIRRQFGLGNGHSRA